MATDPAKYAPKPWSDAESSGLQLAADVVIGGKYKLLRPAGFGGMGAVWVAKNEATGAEVAVKVLLAEEAVSEEAAARFRREAHAAAKLSHRGIVRIFDLVELEGAHKGALVMVMELLRGETLADLFDKRHKLEVSETLEIVLPLLSALNHAHNAGIVHRDLKPENVFLSVDPDGHLTPKILDFGISKVNAPEAPRITGDGALLGTPSYMSPEQARGSHDVDRRSDIFTMGILLYEMLSGKNPFASGSYHSVVAAILEREPDALMTIPLPLWDVIAKALKKAREERFQTAAELATALRESTGTSTTHASNPPTLSIPSVSVTPEPHPADMESPSRRFQPTILDVHGVAKRNQWAMKVVGVLVGVGLALAIAGALIARSTLHRPPAASTRTTAATPAKPTATIPPPEPVASAASTASAAPVPPPPPASPVSTDAVAAAPTSAPLATAQPMASPPSHGTKPRGRKGPRTSKPAPPDPGPVAPAPPPEPKPSTVVRDPGF